MKFIGIAVFIIAGILYEVVWRNIVCKKKITNHIDSIGGEVCYIEKISMRDEIYNVCYTVKGKQYKAAVKFNLFYKTTWH
ncbi:hypothetical protein [Clostridium cylindrosporum]|uniref:Uncharacterized protein n=1 Tax=Clostridium cylindrosporum DSM 605 TaxID=1121307 RepID=A0A0J8DE13_CLOCY|nr:hypothetical protein [Clostridium cylindrosporum]KMT22464.1 hypothetical protein CLCY_10c00090 [Clostridium cylindrosporum DSM 605]